MLKINLNELKQFKAIALYQDGYSYICNVDDYDYIPDMYYFCGFIENIYAKDGDIVFKVYGAGFPNCEKIKHREIKVNMQEINSYKKKIEKVNDISDECINIKTGFQCDSYSSSAEIKLLKNIDFRYVMRKFYEVMPSDDIFCSIGSSMLMDDSIMRLIYIPEDYEFEQY